jgi:hypothetical protein
MLPKTAALGDISQAAFFYVSLLIIKVS